MHGVHILGFAGSLREASFNRAALRAAQERLPPDVKLDAFDIGQLPLYNQDTEQRPPPAVQQLKAQIRRADAILFATPEYNYSVPGVLKNAIDWASRPYGDSAWDGKPCAIMSASIGMLGGARAQYHLRQMLVFLNMFPLNQPEVMIPDAAGKVDAQGRLADETSREKIRELVQALVAWTHRLRGEAAPNLAAAAS